MDKIIKTREEIFQKVIGVLQERCLVGGDEKPTEDMELKTFVWNSIDWLDFIMELEHDVLGNKLPEEDWQQAKTLGEVADLLWKNISKTK